MFKDEQINIAFFLNSSTNSEAKKIPIILISESVKKMFFDHWKLFFYKTKNKQVLFKTHLPVEENVKIWVLFWGKDGNIEYGNIKSRKR